MLAPAKDASLFALTRSADESGVRTSNSVMNIVASQGAGGGFGDMASGVAGMAGQFLPPKARPLLSAGTFVMGGGLSSLMSGNPGGLMGLSGMASQFLPPYAGDALMAGQMLMAGASPAQMMQGLMGRFLPPELQGVWAAAQSMGGLQGMFPSPGSGPTIADAPSLPPAAGGGAPIAARVGDMHTCPMSDGPKPHVGGPILPPGKINVLIGGQPAARVTDKAVCVGPPDLIVQGEPTVLIGSLPAARVGDSTAHGGKIVLGCFTVMIGQARSDTDACVLAAAEAAAGLIQEAPAPSLPPMSTLSSIASTAGSSLLSPRKKGIGSGGFKRGGITAAEANAPHIAAGKRPPYAEGSTARNIVLNKDKDFVRVHGSGNQGGAWIMRRDAIKGLTPAQIKDKFALPEVPTHVSDVKVPAGTKLTVGTVGQQPGWGSGGAVQYELKDRLPSNAFTNQRPL